MSSQQLPCNILGRSLLHYSWSYICTYIHKQILHIEIFQLRCSSPQYPEVNQSWSRLLFSYWQPAASFSSFKAKCNFVHPLRSGKYGQYLLERLVDCHLKRHADCSWKDRQIVAEKTGRLLPERLGRFPVGWTDRLELERLQGPAGMIEKVKQRKWQTPCGKTGRSCHERQAITC